MNEEIARLRKRKEELRKAIEFTHKSKQKVTRIKKFLDTQFKAGKLTSDGYQIKLSQALGNKSIDEWEEYYNSYLDYYKYQIKLCNKLINKERYKGIRGRFTLILIILIILVGVGVLVSLFLILKPVGFSGIMEVFSFDFKLGAAEDFQGGLLNLKEGNLLKESYTQESAVVGKDVKWKKEFTTDQLSGFELKLPEDAKNVRVKKIENGEEEDITKLVEIDRKGVIDKRVEVELKKSKLTGSVVSESSEVQGIRYVVEYETQGPRIKEEEKSRSRKVIKVIGQKDVHYTNVLSYTHLPREINKNSQVKIKLYGIDESGRKEKTDFILYDTNENGLLDYIEWVTPSLSEQVFEIIIEITKAEHLDNKREFISDIYNEVKELDDLWSEIIPNNHYIRVTFETFLDSTRDITIYPRIVSGNPRIEVYEIDGEKKIAEFDSLTSNKYNKVYLKKLEGLQDVFDLKVLGGSVEFNHIIDPLGAPLVFFITPTRVSGDTFDNFIPVNVTADDSGTGDSNVSVFIDFNNSLIGWWRMDEFNGSLFYDNSSYGYNGTYFGNTELLMRFDEGSGNPKDSSPYGNDGTNNGATWQTSGCQSGNCVSFDGKNDYVTLPNNIVGNDESYTISAWVNTTGSTIVQGVYMEGYSGNNYPYYAFNIANDGTIYLYARGNDGGSNPRLYVRSLATVDDGNWHHIVGVRNGSNKADLYIDGSKITSFHGDSAWDEPNSGTFNRNTIGAIRRSDINYYFNGSIDEVGVYSRALSEEEITELFDEGKAKLFNNSVSGKLGRALDFDGEGDYIEVGDIDVIDNSNEFTFCAWVNHSTDTDDDLIFSKTNANIDGISLWRDNLGTAALGSKTDTYSIYLMETGSTDTARFEAVENTAKVGSWKHVCFSIDLGNSTGLKFYINGTEDPNSPLDISGITDISSTTNAAHMGAWIGYPTYDYNGSIDDVMLFNRTLSLEEIRGLYANQSFKYLFKNFTDLNPGNYTFKAYAQDLIGYVNVTEERKVTVKGDDISPDVFFVTPTSVTGETFNHFIFINVTVNDSGGISNNVATFIDFDNSLLGWWRMDEFNSTGVYDNSSYSNSVNFAGGISGGDVVEGSLGEALEFDSVNDFLEAEDSDDFDKNLNSGFSISSWFKVIGSGVNQRIVTKADYNGAWIESSYLFGIGSLGPLYFSVFNTPSSPNSVSTTEDVSLGVWHHAVAVYNGSYLTIYLDGFLNNSVAYSLGVNDGTSDFNIGARCNAGGCSSHTQYFNGSIDDVMLFKRALSEEEVIGLYANQTLKYLFKNFTGLGAGNYNFTAYAQDAIGNVNVTEEREVKIKEDDIPPLISFIDPTLESGNILENFIPINVSANDSIEIANNISTFIDFDNSLIGWWRLDEFNESGIYDNSSYENNGTHFGNTRLLMRFDEGLGNPKDLGPYGNDGINNGATWQTSGCQAGNCLGFDGLSSYVTANGVSGDVAGKSITSIAWINSTNSSQNLITGFNTNTYGNRLLLFMSGSTLQIYDGSWHDSGVVVNDGDWHFVGYTLDDNGGLLNLKVYADGELVDSLTSTVSVVSTDLFSIGQEWDPGPVLSDFFNGSIDEVAVYSKALSEEEMLAHYQTGKAKFTDRVSGAMGDALELDRTDDYINLGNENSLKVTEFTVGGWFYPKQVVGTYSYITKDWNNDPSFFLGTTGVGELIFYLRNDTVGDYDSVTGSTLTANQWIQVMAVCNGTDISLYENGILQDSTPYFGTPLINGDLLIGDSINNPANKFNGSVDDIMFFNRALSGEEIVGLYANTSVKYLFRNFTNLGIGNYLFKAYTQDIFGNVNQTEERDVWFWEGIPGETSCGFLNEENKVYSLTKDVNSSGTCFTIGANNVTLDCKGYEINYSWGGVANRYGIYSTYNFTTIKNCMIKQGAEIGSFDYGVHFYRANNGTIVNNTIITIGSFGDGILLGSSNSNVLMNNTITTSGNFGRGIYISGLNNSLLDNVIATDFGTGIYLFSGLNNSVLNNTLTTSGGSAHGIYLTTNADFNIFSNNTITTLNIFSHGVHFSVNTTDNLFLDMNIETSGLAAHGFSVDNGNHNFTVRDSIVQVLGTASEFHVNFGVSDGNWNFTNVTQASGDPIGVSWSSESNGTVNMMWYYQAYVNDGASPIEEANVTFLNKTPDYLFNLTTDVFGYTEMSDIIEYVIINGSKFYYNNYTVNTSKLGYSSEGHYLNVSFEAEQSGFGGLIYEEIVLNQLIPEIVWMSDIDGIGDGYSAASNQVRLFAYDEDDGTNPDGVTNVTFLAIAQSGGGIGNLYIDNSGDSLYTATLITPGVESYDVNRVGNCVYLSSGSMSEIGGADGVKYNCTVSMRNYDSPGAVGSNPWEARVVIADQSLVNNDPLLDSVNNEEFTVLTVTDLNIVPHSFNWTGANAIDVYGTDQYANSPVVVTNIGNDQLSVAVNGSALHKDSERTPYITAAKFKVDDSGGGCSGNSLNNQTSYVATGLVVSRNPAANTGDLYICISDLGGVNTQGSYFSDVDWDVLFLLVAVSVRNGRRKKKRKKVLKREVLEALEKIEENWDSIEEFLRSPGYKSAKGLAKIKVPVSIFLEKLSPAEALSKYLKENKGLRFRDIGRLINRDERTVWMNYNNALKKNNGKLKEEKLSIPLEVFANRKLSILESAINFLKNKGFKNSEIAELLRKDPRNISTIVFRINKKSVN